MHFEVLVEDASGKIALTAILEKILGPSGQQHSYRIFAYKGIGSIPRNLRGTTDPQKRILLDRLPSLLRGYGKSLNSCSAAVVVVVDLDDRDCLVFKKELLAILNQCNPRPRTLFRIAIEEVEAWLLGDHAAVEEAYPKANRQTLESYVQDSICGTWEKLADAVYPGGSRKLKKHGWPDTGSAKCEWAKSIGPHMDPRQNQSKSFHVFRDGVRKLAGVSA